jgi:hypothetical protein
MNVGRLIKATALAFIVISAPTLRATEAKKKELDWKYDINYGGEKVGYNRIVLRTSLKGERLSEISSVLIPSFFGDTHIHSFKFENYNANRHFMQGEYVYLYDGYLLRTYLEPMEGGLKQGDFIYELDSTVLLQIQSGWAQEFENIVSNNLLVESFLKNIPSLKLLDSSVVDISQKNFDMTLLALSIRLPEKSLKKDNNIIRIFDPESEDSNHFYDISIQSKRVNLGDDQLKSINQGVQKVSVIIKGERLIEYWYDLNTRPVSLLKIVDQSSDEHIEIVRVK